MDGILIVDKPKGLTSHDVVDFIRKRFHLKKVGHAGTLDPLATGVLVILIGSLTKKSADLISQDKEYEVVLSLGVATDTQDGQGEVVKREKVNNLSLEQIKHTFSKFLGRIEQTPPMFSALKIKGKKLYTLARKGIEIKRPSRPVHIYKLEIKKFTSPDINFIINCSKGTYVRTLCADIAERLGCCGYMSYLRRVRSGTFVISQSIHWDILSQLSVQKLSQTLNESY